MFTLTQTTRTGGDCTAGYRVNLDKEYLMQISKVVSHANYSSGVY